MSFEAKLQEMGYTLKPIELNAGRLMLAVRTGNLVYTSGQVPNREGRAIKGKVGQDVSVEEGYEAAKLATLNCLESIRTALGDPRVRTVEGSHGWLLVDPGRFAEEMTNILGAGGAPGAPHVA